MRYNAMGYPNQGGIWNKILSISIRQEEHRTCPGQWRHADQALDKFIGREAIADIHGAWLRNAIMLISWQTTLGRTSDAKIHQGHHNNLWYLSSLIDSFFLQQDSLRRSSRTVDFGGGLYERKPTLSQPYVSLATLDMSLKNSFILYWFFWTNADIIVLWFSWLAISSSPRSLADKILCKHLSATRRSFARWLNDYRPEARGCPVRTVLRIF